MVGITVVLAAAVAPFVFGAVQESESPPNAQISFAYDEGAKSDATDSFARTKAAAGADGFVVINVESVPGGMDADQLFLQTSNSTRPWLHGHTQYSFGDTVRTGESLTTWAERGEEIRVIWESEGSDSSYTIGLFTVPEVDDVALGGPPTPTHNCTWVEAQLGPPPYSGDLAGDEAIDGIVVECDLDQYDVHKLEIINGGVLIGEAEADGDIDINTGGATYDGDVHMLDNGNTVVLDDGANINGDVIAETGGVDLDAGTSIDGEVDAEGDVDVSSYSLIEEGIVTTGNVDLSSDVTVGDKIEAEGDISVSGGSTVEGDIESTDSGSITTTSGTVLGAVATQGDVDVDSSEIQADVFVDGSFDCPSSTINGQNCGSYTPQNYDDY